MEIPIAKKVSFISSLGDFCHFLEKDVNSLLKKEKNHGTNFRSYALAMDTLNGDVLNLKESSNNLKQRLPSLDSFDIFAQSLDDQLNVYSEELDRMEIFLNKFGYHIPEVKDSIGNECMNSNPFLQEEANLVITPRSPLITTVSKRVLADKCKELKTPDLCMVKCAPSVGKEENDRSCEEETPKKSKSPIEQWLDSCSDPCSFTPESVGSFALNTLQIKRTGIRNTMKQDDVRESDQFDSNPSFNLNPLQKCPKQGYSFDCYSSPHTPKQNHCLFSTLEQSERKRISFKENFLGEYNTPVEEINTPEEPTMSDFGQKFCRQQLEPGRLHTPEDPILSNVGKNLLSKSHKGDGYREDIHTPEEPVLNLRPLTSGAENCDLENIYNHEDSLKKSSFDILSSPVISTVTESLLANLRNVKCEETKNDDYENEFYNKVEPVKPLRTRIAELPKSPQLSDITMDIINRRK